MTEPSTPAMPVPLDQALTLLLIQLTLLDVLGGHDYLHQPQPHNQR